MLRPLSAILWLLCVTGEAVADCRPIRLEIPPPANAGGVCRDGDCSGNGRPPWCDARRIGPGFTVHPCSPWELGRVRVVGYRFVGEELEVDLRTECHPGAVAIWSPGWSLGTPGVDPVAVWGGRRGGVVSGSVRFPVPAGCEPCHVRLSWWSGSPRRHHSDEGWAFRGGPPERRGGELGVQSHVWLHDLRELGRRPRGVFGPALDFRRGQ